MNDINVMDAHGNITHHIGASTEWRKSYDKSGREISYDRIDGQRAVTTYDTDRTPSVTWIPPLANEAVS